MPPGARTGGWRSALWQRGAAIGPHARWDCPLRYWAVRNQCPGFLSDGTRDPAAWVGDEITDATRLQWRDFAKTLRPSKGAPAGLSFD